MILMFLVLLGLPQAGPPDRSAVSLSEWFFQEGNDLDPADAGKQPGRRCKGPLEVGEKHGVCWARVTLEAVDKGVWLAVLGGLQTGSLTVNGKSMPTERDELSGLTLCRLFAETLTEGDNILAIRTPGRAAPPAVGARPRGGPFALLSPAAGRWLTRRIEAPLANPIAGNFSIRSGIGRRGEVLPWILARTRDSDGFQPLALAGLAIERRDEDGGRTRLSTEEMEEQRVTDAPPQSIGVYRDRRLGDITTTVSTWAPVALGDAEFSAIPALTTSITITTRSRTPIPIDVRLRLLPLAGGPLRHDSLGAFAVAHNDTVAVAMSEARPLSTSASIAELISSQEAVQPKRAMSQVRIDLVVVAIERPDVSIDLSHAKTPDWQRLLRWTLDMAPERRQRLRRFRAALPMTGDRVLDTRIRATLASCWTSVACDRAGALQSIGTQGPLGLEAYLASTAHLLLFPELERRALLGDRPEDEPLLPLALAILRVHRLCAWDPQIAPPGDWIEQTLASCERLLAMDRDGDGVPDSSPLRPVEAFAYLAALRQTAEMAHHQNRAEAAARLEAAHAKAAQRIHATVDEGGMWDGSGYDSLPPEQRHAPTQTLGVVLGEVPEERVAAVLEAARNASPTADPFAASLDDHLDPLLAWALFTDGQAEAALALLQEWAARADSSTPASPVVLAALMFGDLGLHRRSAAEWVLAPSRDLFGGTARRFHLPEGNLNLTFITAPSGERRVRISGQLEREMRLSIRLPEEDRTTSVDLEAGARLNVLTSIE